MSWTLQETHTLVTEECYSCHVIFAMPERMQRDRLRDRQSFYCPNGHGQVYTGKTDAQKLQEAERRLASREEDLRVARNQRDSERNSRIAVQGHLTRAKKKIERVEKGTCPHCRRHFVTVERHMTTKHSEHTHD